MTMDTAPTKDCLAGLQSIAISLALLADEVREIRKHIEQQTRQLATISDAVGYLAGNS